MSTLAGRGPLAETRRQHLLLALRRDGVVRVSDLTEALGVTPVTVRRDIARLERDGLVRRVHGGAALPVPAPPGPLSDPAVGPGPGAAADARPSAGAPTAPAGAGERAGGPRPRRFGALVPSLDYYWPEVLRGAEEAAAALETQVVLRASSYEAVDERPQLALLLESGVAGLLVALRTDAPSAASTVDWLVGAGVPLVLLERSATTGPHAAVVESVVTDHVLGAAMAVRHLAALGHRRVGLVTTEQSPTSPHLQRGWAEALREAGLHRPDDLERWVPSTRSPDLGAALDEVVERCLATGTTAVLAHADAEAVALVARLEARGLSVPGDLSVVAYDDEVASLVHPPLTAVRPPRRSVGRAAVELLAARVADPARPAHRVLVSPALRVRASTAAPPARPGDGR